MAYIGGGAQAPIDWTAREQNYKLKRRVDELERQVAELQACIDQLEAKLVSTAEALDTVGGAA